VTFIVTETKGKQKGEGYTQTREKSWCRKLSRNLQKQKNKGPKQQAVTFTITETKGKQKGEGYTQTRAKSRCRKLSRNIQKQVGRFHPLFILV
jgi:hypothetical protein